MMQNPVMRTAVEKVQMNPAFENIPPNNYQFLHEVDRTMQRMIDGAKVNDPSTAYVYSKYKDMFNKFLKNNNPAYEAANKAAQPKIVRRNIEEKLNKESDDYTAKNFYSKFLNSRKSYQSILQDTRNFPEARKMITDMRSAWKNLSNMKTTSQSESQAKTALDHARNFGNYIVTMIKNMSGSKGDIRRLNFIYSNDWEKGFAKLSDIKNENQRIKEMIHYVSKTAAAAGLSSNQIDNLVHMINDEN